MRSIAVLNQKGGVGKTTTAVNLAAALGRRGVRTLLVDLDPQAHATLHVGVDLAGGPSIYDVLLRGTAMAEVVRYVDEHLAIAPAHIDLAAAELELADRPSRERSLADLLLPYHDQFDYLLIDCAPSLGLLTINALAAVREVLIPLQPHFLALQGLGRLLETVALVRAEIQPTLRVAGVVFTMAENTTRLAQEVYADVERFLSSAAESDAWHGASVCRTRIRRNIKLAECPSFGQTVFQYAPSSHGAEDYAALADEIVALALSGVARSATTAVESAFESPAGREVSAEVH